MWLNYNIEGQLNAKMAAGAMTSDINRLILGAKNDVKNADLQKEFDGLIDDESVFVELTIESIKQAFLKLYNEQEAKISSMASQDDHFKEYSLDEEEINIESGIKSEKNDFSEIDVDKLIADSYNVDKTDEEKVESIMGDLKEILKMYGHIFIGIGQQIERSKKRR